MPTSQAPRSSRQLVALVLSLALAMAATVSVAPVLAAESFDDRLREAQQEAAEAQSELEALSAEATAVRDELVGIQTRLEDATARLRTLDGQVALASQELEQREIVAAEAAAEAAAAADQLDVIEADLASQEQLLGDQLAMAWIHGSTSGPALVYELLQTSASPSDVAADLYRIETVLDGQAHIVEDVETLRGEQVVAVDAARAARLEAERLRQEAADAVELVQGLRDQAAAVRAEVAIDRDRQAAILASIEADADQTRAVLASVKAEQGRIEAARQQAIEAEQEAQRQREEEARRRQEESRSQQEESGEAPATGGGSGSPSTGPCAVDGARAGRDFTNDWGYPRPGGRSHEGTDIFANRGTPVRSIGSGTVKELRYTDTGLGGLYVSVWVGPGEHWYYSHLDAISPGLAPGVPISDGQQLGTVGNTGNARTTPPHLHIGHYFDDVAENPYPILESRCR